MVQVVDKTIIDGVINNKLEAIFGFCIKRTDNRQDAEDLTQDIIIEVYKSFPKLKRFEGLQALEGWVWAVARNTYCRWLNKNSNDSVVYIEGFVGTDKDIKFDTSIDDEFIKAEKLNLLREQISLLSKNYRDILVMYYLEEKSCKVIASKLSVSVNTVKWRLHEAKRMIKERMDGMRLYTERSYAPGNLWVTSGGIFNAPYSCTYVYNQLKSLLRQNIALCCYREPLTMGEISVELGVPRAYIEEDIDELAQEELLKIIGKDRYQTDFIIITDEIQDKLNDMFKELGNKLAEFILEKLSQQEKSIRDLGFIGNDKPWEELLWVLTVLCVYGYESNFSESDMPMKPHGNRWMMTGYEGTKMDNEWRGGVTKNVSLKGAFTQAVYYNAILTNRAGFLEHDDIKFYYDCIAGKVNLSMLDEGNLEIAARLIDRGFLVKSGGNIVLNMICFNEQQYYKLESIMKDIYKQFDGDTLIEIHKNIKSELEKNVPQQLHNQIEFCATLLLSDIAGYIYKAMFESHILSMPEELEKSIKGMYVVAKF